MWALEIQCSHTLLKLTFSFSHDQKFRKYIYSYFPKKKIDIVCINSYLHTFVTFFYRSFITLFYLLLSITIFILLFYIQYSWRAKIFVSYLTDLNKWTMELKKFCVAQNKQKSSYAFYCDQLHLFYTCVPLSTCESSVRK